MVASSKGLTPFSLVRLRGVDAALSPLHDGGFVGLLKRRLIGGGGGGRDWRRAVVKCCSQDSVVPIRRSIGPRKSADKCSEEWRFDSKITPKYRVRVQASPAMPFAASPQ